MTDDLLPGLRDELVAAAGVIAADPAGGALEAVQVLVCPWEHVTLWPSSSTTPAPTECPARTHSTPEWWGRCRKRLAPARTLWAAAEGCTS